MSFVRDVLVVLTITLLLYTLLSKLSVLGGVNSVQNTKQVGVLDVWTAPWNGRVYWNPSNLFSGVYPIVDLSNTECQTVLDWSGNFYVRVCLLSENTVLYSIGVTLLGKITLFTTLLLAFSLYYVFSVYIPHGVKREKRPVQSGPETGEGFEETSQELQAEGSIQG